MNNIKMSYFRKKLERRTFSQDRYYILIKRQRSGKATFNELTELDEIVNRVPDIREKVIIESFFTENIDNTGGLPNSPGNDEKLQAHSLKHHGFWGKIKSFINRVFSLQMHAKTHEFYLLY
jgi:hypothetical protein